MLKGLWHLVDRDDTYHIVVYNRDLDQPAIVAGWTTLCHFYHLTADHLVWLHHYSKSVFLLKFLGFLACRSHSPSGTLCIIKCHVLWPSRFFLLSRKFPIVVWWENSYFPLFSLFKCHSINFKYTISLVVRTFQVQCIIFWKTKTGIICTWEM